MGAFSIIYTILFFLEWFTLWAHFEGWQLMMRVRGLQGLLMSYLHAKNGNHPIKGIIVFTF